ncbi:hypothetical protein CBF35_05120 [Vagococcus salmoninarum]|uniref:WxL domain-containing protein n=1 Tax=Vagococcus salmoninarum TaxID=2739 RepID=A0A429ZSA0_9ENTE|nr:MucBP domain-containing protein [Vagococcus salmoninarum]RST96614.1 hypothetical protein CBF35_05120 [Vagococcus salmoninarum]
MKKITFKKALVALMVCTNLLSPVTSIAATTIDSSQTMNSIEETMESSNVPENSDSQVETNVPANSESSEQQIDNLSLTFAGTTFYKDKDFEIKIKGVAFKQTFVLRAPNKLAIQEDETLKRNQGSIKALSKTEKDGMTEWEFQLLKSEVDLSVIAQVNDVGVLDVEIESNNSSAIDDILIVNRPQISLPNFPELKPSTDDETRLFDYKLLDEKGDRDGFKKQSINTPVKIPFARQDEKDTRDYYMYFGSVKKFDKTKNFVSRKNVDPEYPPSDPTNDKTGSTVGLKINGDLIPVTSPQVIAVPNDQNGSVISYSFAQELGGYGGRATFDLASVNSNMEILSGVQQGGAGSDPRIGSHIEELYTDEKNGKIMAYGKLEGYGYEQGMNETVYYVRVLGAPVNNSTGRIRYSMKYYNATPNSLDVVPSFGVHMDIQGLHDKSLMYSLGDRKGIYFKEDGEKGRAVGDGLPYYVFFYRDGYGNGANPPAKYKGNDDAEYTLKGNFREETSLNISEEKDPGKDNTYPYYSHPGWIYLWNKKTIPSKGIDQIDMDISVGTVGPDKIPVTVNYLNEDGDAISAEKSYIIDEGKSYSEKPKKINGFEYDRVEGSKESGIVKEGDVIEINYFYTSEQFELSQEVTHLDGTTADAGNVKTGEELIYTVNLTSNIKSELLTPLYNKFEIKNVLDENLEDVKDVTLVNSSGKNVGTAKYDTGSKAVVGSLKLLDNVKSSESLVLSYHATVKNDAPGGSKIKEQATAGGTYSGIPEIPAREQTSNEVESTVVNSASVLVKYVNEDGVEIHERKAYELAEDGKYDEKEIDIDGFVFDHAEGATSGTAQAGEVVEIIFHYKSEQFEIIQKVSRLDGSSADIVKNEEELIYTVELNSKLKEGTILYNDFTIVEEIDLSLEDIKEVTFVDSKGKTVGTAAYDSGTNTVTATLSAADAVPSTESLVLSYHGKVKADAPEGTIIKEQATAGGSYVGTPEIPAREQVSNEVESKIMNSATVLVKYVNEDGVEISESKSYELDEDGNYEEHEIEIDGFIFDHAEGTTSGTAQPGENVIIIFHYKSNQFEITQEVSRLDGSSANAVKNEEELIYTVKVTSKLQTETSLYNEFVINEPIDPSLENIKDVTLVDGAGQPVGKATFDSAKQAVVATLAAADKVKGTENLVLSYHATVKKETAAPQGTEIKEQATAGGSYVGTPEIPAREQTSNEVISVIIGGELIFESAPDTLDFGQDLKISLREETYPVITKDNPLTVIDTRGKGEVWSMTAKMTKLMVNGEHTLAESMHYIMNGKSQLMTLETSANVYDKVTDSDDAVVISDEWLETTEGPVLKVGKNEAQLGNYQGIIQWTLQDVPLSE